ncbi:MAG: Phosphate-import protein PhnD precursor, partial [Pseudomonadota bacterium]
MKLARILATGLISLGAISAFAQNISFGIIATDSASAQRERWEPFFRDMEKKTGLKIQSFYAPDYAGVIEAMR